MEDVTQQEMELNKYKDRLLDKPVSEVLKNDFCNTFDCNENCKRCWNKILNS